MMPPQSIPSSGRQTRPPHYPHLQPAAYNYALYSTTPFSVPVDAVSYLSPSLSPLSGVESSPSSTLHSVATPTADWPSLFRLDEPTFNPAALSTNERVMQTEPWLPNGQLTPRSVGRFSHQRDCSCSSLGSNGPASPHSHNIADPQIALINDSVRDNFHAFSDASDLNNYELATPKSFPGPAQALPAVPKLGRTVSDAYSDGLYSPNFTIASSSPTGHVPLSPSSELFAQRLQAANKQHMSAVNSPVSASSRDRSPFYDGSPLASLPTTHDFPSTVASSQMPFRTLQQMRETKALQEPVMQHMARSSDTSAPQTISPKDAMLEYHEPEGSANLPLFPQPNTNGFNGNAISTATAAQPTQAFDGLPRTHAAFEGLAMGQSTFKYPGSQIPATMQVPQPYSFVAQQRLQSAVPSSVSTGSAPATRLGSADTAATESAHGGTPLRPVDTRAGGGTYSCTYQNCSQRFDSPGQLQKHKKEFHRQVHGGLGGGGGGGSGGGAARRQPEGDAELNTQAGPHRCDRVNPSTGKPCNTVFSRPYDLTRHEDTIHNARRQKVRCEICTDGKTFSRADALTRHLNVKHGIPAEKRRRGGGAHAVG